MALLIEFKLYLFYSTGFCECPQGQNRGPCKHKQAITKFHGVAEFTHLPYMDPFVRAAYHYIATGETLDGSWYRELDAPASNPDVAHFVQEHREQHASNSVTFDEAGPSTTVIDDNAEDNSLNNEEEDIDTMIAEYKENYSKFESKLFSNLQKREFFKCFKKFTKAIGRLSKSNDETFQRKLFNFSQHESKTKKGKYIAVQPTAIARRKYKHRGRMAASYGRRVKDTALKAQLICDNDNVYFSLPNQKPRSNRLAHSLKASIDSNRPNAKKH